MYFFLTVQKNRGCSKIFECFSNCYYIITFIIFIVGLGRHLKNDFTFAYLDWNRKRNIL